MQAYMMNCADTICRELQSKEITQRHVALSYALAMRTYFAKVEDVDWHRINRAILDRWSKSGLERIKKRAVDLCSGKITPEAAMR